jgi:DnaJ-class molecular chaperone
MAHMCEECNGTGIIDYDSDLPRLEQERCRYCGGEGVAHD